ncbi:hypothetical protein E2562_026462 [Oryza meyeriana var. granulata]|uniref:Uncharacterized protein n=1 Tax=Oryza meyeriana var. granulata TaxID=110450 RepID=A0A6G1DPA7_9ORYZ|nr:hypothetical protein E2562_026462 [Oryza meyeriana var. granulata]
MASVPSSAISTSSPDFDYFMLALQWPATVCRSSSGPCCSSNAGCRSTFTVPCILLADGLWPPTCCNHADFDMAKISSLTTELEKYWPSLYCSSPSLCTWGQGSLWAHEAMLASKISMGTDDVHGESSGAARRSVANRMFVRLAGFTR